MSLKVTRKWIDEFGFWEYSCGCLQYQDGYDLICHRHSGKSYTVLVKDLNK